MLRHVKGSLGSITGQVKQQEVQGMQTEQSAMSLGKSRLLQLHFTGPVAVHRVPSTSTAAAVGNCDCLRFRASHATHNTAAGQRTGPGVAAHTLTAVSLHAVATSLVSTR